MINDNFQSWEINQDLELFSGFHDKLSLEKIVFFSPGWDWSDSNPQKDKIQSEMLHLTFPQSTSFSFFCYPSHTMSLTHVEESQMHIWRSMCFWLHDITYRLPFVYFLESPAPSRQGMINNMFLSSLKWPSFWCELFWEKVIFLQRQGSIVFNTKPLLLKTIPIKTESIYTEDGCAFASQRWSVLVVKSLSLSCFMSSLVANTKNIRTCIASALLQIVLLPVIKCGCTAQNCINIFRIDRAFFTKHCCLREVPQDIPSDAIKVDLEYNLISIVPSGIFNDLSKCTWLTLEHNTIYSVSKAAFSGMHVLHILCLNNNRIAAFESGNFTGLQSLCYIYVSRNNLHSLNYGTFEGLDDLLQLVLDTNEIIHIEKGAFHSLHYLQALDMGRNRISILLFGVFQGLVLLEKLDLGYNRIFWIESGVFNPLKSLKVLELRANQFVAIKPGTLFPLMNLQTLYLDGNHMTTIGKGALKSLYHVEKLLLGGNRLSIIEEEAFDYLHSIREIHLEGNRFTTLHPDIFINLPRPLLLTLSHSKARHNNQWKCTSLCWLYHEERHKTITWSDQNFPECVENEYKYNMCPFRTLTWRCMHFYCEDSGEFSSSMLVTPITLWNRRGDLHVCCLWADHQESACTGPWYVVCGSLFPFQQAIVGDHPLVYSTLEQRF